MVARESRVSSREAGVTAEGVGRGSFAVEVAPVEVAAVTAAVVVVVVVVVAWGARGAAMGAVGAAALAAAEGGCGADLKGLSALALGAAGCGSSTAAARGGSSGEALGPPLARVPSTGGAVLTFHVTSVRGPPTVCAPLGGVEGAAAPAGAAAAAVAGFTEAAATPGVAAGVAAVARRVSRSWLSRASAITCRIWNSEPLSFATKLIKLFSRLARDSGGALAFRFFRYLLSSCVDTAKTWSAGCAYS